MNTLRERILGALQLAPMTISELSRCLCARPTYVQRLLADMRVKHRTRICGKVRMGSTRPDWKWERVA